MWASLIVWIIRYLGVYLLCFGAGFYSHIKLENWWRGTDSEENSITMTAKVVNVESGNTFRIQAGIFGKRTRNVILYGIEIPSEVADEAKSNLSSLLSENDSVSVSIEEGKRQMTDVVGIVHAQNGVNVNLEQLRMGVAKTTIKDKEFLNAQNEAVKAKRGIWKSNENPKPKPWWRDGENEQ